MNLASFWENVIVSSVSFPLTGKGTVGYFFHKCGSYAGAFFTDGVVKRINQTVNALFHLVKVISV